MNATPDDQFNRDVTILTRIKGWRLILLWMIWVAVTLTVVLVTFGTIRQFIHENLYGGPLTEQIKGRGVSPSVFFPLEFSMSVIQLISWYLLAGLIVFRRRDDWVAIIASIMIFVQGYFLTGFSNVWIAGYIPPHLAFFNNLGWLLDAIAFASVMIFFGTFPEGRFVPRWIIPVFAFLFLYVAVEDFIMIIDPNIGTVPGFSVFIRFILIPVLIIFPQLYRRNRMGAVQRQQTKFALAGIIIGDLGNIIWQLAIANQTPFSQLVYLIARPFTFMLFVFAPISFTYAILRYRLWDIDFVFNRSMVYGGLTALLGTVFIGGFFALRTIMEIMFGNQQDLIAVAVPAVFITALFTPTRNRLQRYVDQRFYGIEIDYKKAMEDQAWRQKQVASAGDVKTSFDKYTGLELIGRGGMGEVYRAKHPTLNCEVAIKILPKHLAENEAAYRRYDHEAQAIAQLKHPNIVGMYDYGRLDGTPYIVLEYIDGQILSEILKQRERLSLTEALPLFKEIASALDYSHAAGIIHRDIKPSNVMIERDTDSRKSQRAVLMDFGIAKLHSSMTQLTGTGILIGTLDYVSPEQIRGASEVDEKADIYSFGAMVYQTLTGALPFEHKNISALLMAHLMQPVSDPRELRPNLPEAAAKAIMRAMAKEPQMRQKTAGEFISQLAGRETI
jgi:hypothetical protein